ncbi:MAG: rod shape-determining protein MreC [Deltaproteobacteria bacterium]|jgi:rod shape-determining protein MreC|nr:rod shape-determining protein MreC [Deltaproteobacteria bacterium]
MWILNFIKENVLSGTAIFLLIISFCLTAKSFEKGSYLPSLGINLVGRVIAPAEKGRHELFQSIAAAWNRYVNLWDIEKSRNLLFTENKALEDKIASLIEVEYENQRLRKLLNFGQSYPYKLIGATVIGRNSSNWVRSLTINRGKQDGMKVGSPVVDGKAVVGQIIAVSKKTSTVLLLTDNISGIDALIQSSRTPGIIKGTGTAMLEMNYVLKGSGVVVGDKVISSGLDGIYPKGKLIGTVTKAEDTVGLVKKIEVKPSMDLFKLEEVLVLVSE